MVAPLRATNTVSVSTVWPEVNCRANLFHSDDDFRYGWLPLWLTSAWQSLERPVLVILVMDVLQSERESFSKSNKLTQNVIYAQVVETSVAHNSPSHDRILSRHFFFMWQVLSGQCLHTDEDLHLPIRVDIETVGVPHDCCTLTSEVSLITLL